MRPFGVPNHPVVSRVECNTLAGELRQILMSVRSHDKTVIQLHKDVQAGKNKAADTVASFLVDSHNGKSSIADAFASTIRDFFSARVNRLRRTMRELSPIETREEGELNSTQVAVDQGDTSTPTLKRFIAEIDENISVLIEMRAAAAWELYRLERGV